MFGGDFIVFLFLAGELFYIGKNERSCEYWASFVVKKTGINSALGDETTWSRE